MMGPVPGLLLAVNMNNGRERCNRRSCAAMVFVRPKHSLLPNMTYFFG